MTVGKVQARSGKLPTPAELEQLASLHPPPPPMGEVAVDDRTVEEVSETEHQCALKLILYRVRLAYVYLHLFRIDDDCSGSRNEAINRNRSPDRPGRAEDGAVED